MRSLLCTAPCARFCTVLLSALRNFFLCHPSSPPWHVHCFTSHSRSHTHTVLLLKQVVSGDTQWTHGGRHCGQPGRRRGGAAQRPACGDLKGGAPQRSKITWKIWRMPPRQPAAAGEAAAAAAGDEDFAVNPREFEAAVIGQRTGGMWRVEYVPWHGALPPRRRHDAPTLPPPRACRGASPAYGQRQHAASRSPAGAPHALPAAATAPPRRSNGSWHPPKHPPS